jgi:hypothetical protein
MKAIEMTIMSEMKNTLDGINNTLDVKEEEINEFDGIEILSKQNTHLRIRTKKNLKLGIHKLHFISSYIKYK